jgi:hypothetical protein
MSCCLEIKVSGNVSGIRNKVHAEFPEEIMSQGVG